MGTPIVLFFDKIKIPVVMNTVFLLLLVAGLLCFALFFKSIRFFEKI